MKSNLIFLGYVLAFSLLFYAGCYTERGRWEKALVEIQLKVSKQYSTIQKLRVDSAALATQHKIDTLVFTKQIVKWKDIIKTVFDTTPGRVDTLTKVQIVQIADSTIKSCNIARLSCESLRINAEERASKLDQTNADLKRLLARPPSLFTVQLPRVLTVGLIILGITQVIK